MFAKALVIILAVVAISIFLYGIANEHNKGSMAGALSPFAFVILVLISKIKQKSEDKEFLRREREKRLEGEDSEVD